MKLIADERERLIVALTALFLCCASDSVRADMYPDASNAKLPEALVNFGHGTQLAASVTCTTANGSPSVTGCNSTAGLAAGMAVRGSGIPADTTITSGITATGFTLSANATASGSGLLTIRHLPFWSDDGGEPSIWRHPGRVFIGNAIGQPSSRFTLPYWTFCPNTATCANWAARDADLAVMSSRGAMAVMGFSRSSDGVSPNPASPIGLAGFLHADTRGGWASYMDVQLEAAAAGAYAFGVEMAVKNKGSNYTTTTYNSQPGAYGIRLSGGGDPAYGGTAANSANTAIQIASIAGGGPPHTWNKGIVFAQAALTGTDGYSGCCGSAIEMARGHWIRWQTPNQDAMGFSIRSEVNDVSGQIQIVADDNNFSLYGNTGTSRLLELTNTASAVNYVKISNAVLSAAPVIEAHSVTDPNVSLTLQPQGTGTVNPAGGLKLPNYTVATLPACNTAYSYVMAAVSDATAPAYNAALTGGGAVKIPVMCDGAAWKAH